MQHAAGAEEEQALEHGMVHQVIETGQKPDGGEPRQICGPAVDARAHPEQDDADVLHGVVG